MSAARSLFATSYRDRFDDVPLPDADEADAFARLARYQSARRTAGARDEALADPPRAKVLRRRDHEIDKSIIAATIALFARFKNGVDGSDDGRSCVLSQAMANALLQIIPYVTWATLQRSTTLAKLTRLCRYSSEATVRAALSALERMGLVERRFDTHGLHLRLLFRNAAELHAMLEAHATTRRAERRSKRTLSPVRSVGLAPSPLDPVPDRPPVSDGGAGLSRHPFPDLDRARAMPRAAPRVQFPLRSPSDGRAAAPPLDDVPAPPARLATPAAGIAAAPPPHAVPALPARLPTAPPGARRESRTNESTGRAASTGPLGASPARGTVRRDPPPPPTRSRPRPAPARGDALVSLAELARFDVDALFDKREGSRRPPDIRPPPATAPPRTDDAEPPAAWTDEERAEVAAAAARAAELAAARRGVP